ncbi:MAG: FAD-dependent oxidoreductase [Lentisphaerae bacterium]|nr:FAD-dependent oxidoreductase [Lentisphaerota bacterium]
MQTITHKVDFCVIGGGLAGMCAAITAARHGVKTLIMQERPVFGGNASSEIRMWVCGAPGCLETGIVEELRLENLNRNPHVNFSIWDSILFEKIRFQENLTSLLNCSCQSAEMEDNCIKSVTGWQMTTQTFHKVEAKYFADCSGDSILAPLSGAEFRIGREDKNEFSESLAHDTTDRQTMGMSCLIQAREYDSPRKFVPPPWANVYTEEDMAHRDHQLAGLENFWWLELGGDQDSIADSETLRDELLKTAFGIWDHIKNGGDHHADNWDLEWVGFLPGKRESRRCIGDHILNQNDMISGGKFADTVAYGGWPVDDHHPAGFKHRGAPNRNIILDRIYGIPLRSLYSKNIGNLFFAGRNISTTHIGLSSCRVMATCATLGQAVGAAVSTAVENGYISPRETAQKHIKEVQSILLDDDCYLPGFAREIPEICRKAKLSSSSGNPEVLRNGIDRELNGNENFWHCQENSFVQYDFEEEQEIHEVRIVFNSDLSRPHLNIRALYFLNDGTFSPPETLVEDFDIFADGKVIAQIRGNFQRLVKIPVSVKAKSLKLVIRKTRSNQTKCGVFSFDAR